MAAIIGLIAVCSAVGLGVYVLAKVQERMTPDNASTLGMIVIAIIVGLAIYNASPACNPDRTECIELDNNWR